MLQYRGLWPEKDDKLIKTAANVKGLKSIGVIISRYNISSDGEVFQKFSEAIEEMKRDGLASFPCILKEGKIVITERYPDKEEGSPSC